MKRTAFLCIMVAAALVLVFSCPAMAAGGCNGNLPASTLSSTAGSVQNSWQDYKAALGSKGSSLTSHFSKPEFKSLTNMTVSGKSRYRSLK
jgi:hypothetical protein